MPTKTLDQRLASKLEAQKKLGEEIAELKREQAKREKAERQKVERQLGRLAVQCGLGEFAQDELKGVFQKAQRELSKRHPNGRHPGDPFNSEDDLVKVNANSNT